MEQLRNRTRLWVSVILLGMMGVVSSGCGVAPPTAPQAGITPQGTVQPATVTGTSVTWTTVASAWVDKGQAATVAGSRYQLGLVRGATPAGAQVTLAEHDPSFCDVMVGPSSMALGKTCSLTISYGGTSLSLNADQLKLYRYNESTGAWAPVSGTNDLSHETFTGKISALGRYQLSPSDPGKAGW